MSSSVIWGSAAAIAGPIYTLLGASVLFLVSLLLGRRLSINVTRNLEERVSGVLSVSVKVGEVTPIVLTRELFASGMIRRKIKENEHNKNEALRGPLMFTIPACGFVVAPKLDWLYKINRVADCAQSFSKVVKPADAAV
jgi:hypothetical protein